MVAGRSPEGSDTCFSVPGRARTRLLPVAAVYGANASGKSNFVQALTWLKGAVTGVKTSFAPFLLDENAVRIPTSCEIVLLLGERLWEYHLSMLHAQVVYEALYEHTSGKLRAIFERHPSEKNFRIGKTLACGKEELAFAAQLGKSLPSEKLYLSTIQELRIPGLIDLIEPIYQWFEQSLVIVRAHDTRLFLGRDLSKNPKLYGDALQRVDTGIEGLDLVPIPMEDANVPEQVLEHFRQSDAPVLYAADLPIQIVKREDGIQTLRWVARHPLRGSSRHVNFTLEAESDGTQRFLNLLPIVLDNSQSAFVYVIDELDRSLHPILSHLLINKHLEQTRRGLPRQIIFTVHDVQLLEDDLLRRDEVWFVEKDEAQVSRLVPLSDFKVRNDMNLRKGYLAGKFGGIPDVYDFSTAN